MTTTIHWNAIYTRANCEHRVSRLLKKKRIVHYFPQNLLIVDSLSQKRILPTALFPSIIFVQAETSVLLSLKQLDNIHNVVYWQQEPAVFPAAEIDLLRRFLDMHETVAVTKRALRIGNETACAEQINIPYRSGNKVYSIDLPTIGYSLAAKAGPVTNVRLVRKILPVTGRQIRWLLC